MRIPLQILLTTLGEAEPIVIERAGAPTVNDLGDVTHGAPTEIEAVAVVHQATREQLERAGLDVSTDARAFYTAAEIRTVSGDRAPDVVRWAGLRWEIVNIGDYSALGGLFLALGLRQG